MVLACDASAMRQEQSYHTGCPMVREASGWALPHAPRLIARMVFLNREEGLASVYGVKHFHCICVGDFSICRQTTKHLGSHMQLTALRENPELATGTGLV